MPAFFSRRLREGENEVIYTETDCVKGLSMFRGDMAIKTTYRVTRDRGDPENSVRVKVDKRSGFDSGVRRIASSLSICLFAVFPLF